jgi:cytidine deaminase
MEDLLRLAEEASKNAYAPYSKFSVGAALLTDKGETFTGVNVENVSSGLTVCAERNAIACAVAAGARRFKAIAIFSPSAKKPLYPCGACLQVLAEFASDLNIHLKGPAGRPLRTTLKKLLPHAFGR